MAKNKAKGKGGKYKPHRVVRIPEHTAVLLEQLADDDDETLAYEVRRACKRYLIYRGKLKPPPTQPD